MISCRIFLSVPLFPQEHALELVDQHDSAPSTHQVLQLEKRNRRTDTMLKVRNLICVVVRLDMGRQPSHLPIR